MRALTYATRRSALALAQTSSTTTTAPSSTTTTMPSNTMTPTVAPPASGSHPAVATPTTGSTTDTTTGAATTTAPGPQSAMKTDQDVMKKLQAAGYSDVTDVKQEKNGYTASALKNGKRVKVDIDANGKIGTMN